MKAFTYLSGLVAANVINAATVSTRGTEVNDCLGKKNVPVKYINSPGYDQLAEPFNLRLQYKPYVIVYPNTTQHVQDAVACAKECNVKVQAKSGGHSYASFSSGGKDGSMMIDLEPFQDIKLDTTTNIATVGGGVRLGNLAQGIWDQGKRGLPHGTCPGVGIGGHFTHGGYGHTSRHWGLALDTIVALDVVLADGSLVHATAQEHSDIFWAVRGAADSFGIVVNFYLQTNEAPESVTYIAYQWANQFDKDNRQGYIDLWKHLQAFATNSSVVDDRISFGVYEDGTVFNLGGLFFGTPDEFKAKIEPELIRGIPTPNITVKAYSWIDYLILVSDKTDIKEPLTGYDEHDNFFAKSITVPESKGFSDASLGAWFDYIQNNAAPTPFFVITNLYGGPGSKINEKDTNFAAYHDRDSLWVLQLYGNKPDDGNAAIPYINGLTNAITSAAPDTDFGAYLNYVDPSLSASEAHHLYYGDELYAKLLDLKKQVDPTAVYWNPQTVGN